MENSHKITIQELIDLLCEKTEVNKQQAENFIKSVFAVIEEKLLAGEHVKINNFGVFKMQWNESRKSVNINTGEEFIIDGFYKLIFTPEQKLKDAVNKPFTHLKTIELDEETTEDPLSIFQDQATEIKDILSEISSMNEVDDKLKTEVKEIEEIEEENKDIEVIIIEEEEKEKEIVLNPKEINKIEEKNTEKMAENVVITENIQIEKESIESEEKSKMTTKRKNKKELNNNRKSKKNYAVRYILLLITLTIIGVTIAYFSSSCFECWLRYDLLNEKGRHHLDNIENTISNWFSYKNTVTKDSDKEPAINDIYKEKTDSVLFNAEIIDESQDEDLITDDINIEDDESLEKDDVQPQVDTTSPKADTSPKKDDSPKIDTTPKKDETPQKDVNKKEENLEQLFRGPRVYNEFVATETIGRGVSLTLLAHKYYGDRDFWVYIHEANSNKYENPGNIPAGVEISVPKLDKRLIDTSNPLCKEKARELQGKYMKN